MLSETVCGLLRTDIKSSTEDHLVLHCGAFNFMLLSSDDPSSLVL